ncbi:MAG: radical SAM protein, partial [Elusimicrobiaceae bacterium]|nr:radical SAM protein [Elusimicrobiaceae bacterium]
TLHDDLPRFLADIKALGYKTKLDTNGSRPEMLEKLLSQKLVDFVAMDLKAPFEKYSLITEVDTNAAVIKQSMKILQESGVAYEFRTTYDKEILNDADIALLANMVEGKNYKVQECLPVAKEKAALKVMHEEL